MKESIIQQFGFHVRNLRKEYGFTQEELAGRTNISLKYIQKIESKNPPDVSIGILEKISKGFGIPLWKLLKFK